MPSTKRYLLNAAAYATFFEMLSNGGGTIRDIAAETGLAEMTVRKVISVMHRRKTVYIVSWEKDLMGRSSVRSYALGPGKDAKRPPPKTAAAKCAAYYIKQKQVAATTGGLVKEARLAGTRVNVFGLREAA